MDRISKNNLIIKYQKEFINQFRDNNFFTAISPGRINIIGEHTDYNLGLAMPIAIDRWICSVVSIRDDNKINIYSSNFNEKISLNLNDLNANKTTWKKYVFGCIKIFMDEYNIHKGLNILIGGNVPIGFGMSSSAALEVSLLASLIHAFNISIDNYKILELSNRVERDFLGIQSGLLDQYASIFSKKDKPLLIDFSTLSHVYVDSKIKNASWILINSMVDRSLVDSKYNERVNECKLGLKQINDLYKTQININQITYTHLEKLKNFNKNRVIYNRIYHILSENDRVHLMKEALEKGDLNLIGEILNNSHDSLSNHYQVSCKEIDVILDISKKQRGFYGGRIMGGGFGGCCLGLINDSDKDFYIENLIENFYNQFKYKLKIEIVDFSDGLQLV